MKHYEDMESIALFDWAQRIPILKTHLIHIPNGGRRNKREAARFKRMGVRKGVHDYFLPVARGIYHGLWVELKATPPHDARVTKEQTSWCHLMIAAGYAAFIVKGWDSARDVLLDYLNLDEGDCFDSMY